MMQSSAKGNANDGTHLLQSVGMAELIVCSRRVLYAGDSLMQPLSG